MRGVQIYSIEKSCVVSVKQVLNVWKVSWQHALSTQLSAENEALSRNPLHA